MMRYQNKVLSTGAINASTWKTITNLGINAVANMLIPQINIPLGDFNISFSPAFGFGEGGLNMGVNFGLSYNDGYWNFGVYTGFGSTYSGWLANVGYEKTSIGYGVTYYNSTTIGEYTTGKQAVGTGRFSYGDFSLSASNDLFAEKKQDRWRTSAVEMGIGDFLIGTSVFTNNGKAESPWIDGSRHLPINDPIVGPHYFDKKEGKTYGAWTNGQVFSAPFWIGVRNGNTAYRAGFSSKIVQSLTQNLVHKYMPTPYFLHYNNFKSGAFSYYGYYNPLTLWNN